MNSLQNAPRRKSDIRHALTISLDAFFPPSPHPDSLLHAPMTSHLRSSKEFERQASFISEAEAQGKVVYRGEADEKTRRMGFSLVKLNLDGVGEKGGLVEEEIFGPVLPIIPVSVSRLDAIRPT